MKAKLRPVLKYAALLASAIALSMTIIAPSQAQNQKVRVGVTISVDGVTAAFLMAVDNGSFAKAGLDVDVKPFVQSNQKYDTIKAGGLDMDIDMGAINAAQLYSGGVPIVVLRAGTPADIWAVIARQDSKLTRPSDFKGKKYGVVSLSGTNYGTTYLAFKTEGIDFQKDVRVSTLPPATLVTALENGEIEGATTYEPFLSQAMKTGRVKVLFRPGDVYEKKYGEPFLALVVAGRKEYVEKNRAAVQKFMSVLEASLAALPQHTDEAAKAMVKYMPEMKMSEAETKELVVKYMPNIIKSQNTPEFVKSVQNMYDRLLEAKQLKQPVKASEFWIRP
ncbi:MAG TPA: ABC transporter substrate-binding protein [Herbaspirillum sp.]|jgi:phthalate transport system substrate-binding protein